MTPALPIRDPAGLLVQIAELEPLCVDPFVRRAVARGDPFRVYRSLWWAWRTGRLRAHRATLRALLRSRRAFARPVREGEMSLGSIDGVGIGLVGRAEREEDGTLIKTRVLELAGIPLFPLGAHLVSVREEYGELREAVYYARVPLGTGWWLWRSLWTGLAAAALAGTAWSALETVLRSEGS
jgi:hypothetical protein